MTVLCISNLHVSVGDKPILKGLTLDVPADAAPAVMGPSGAHHAGLCYGRARRPS